MIVAKDLSGQRFGRLIAIVYKGNCKWLCRCDCGKEKIVMTGNLIKQTTRSCGCLNIESLKNRATHGMSKSHIYAVYKSMCLRCLNKNIKGYKYYGARGISVDSEWLGDFGFVNFLKWALDYGYKKGLTIERINNNLNYGSSNCTWATMKVQCNNTRKNKPITFDGKTQNYTQWENELGFKCKTICRRLNRGWSIEETLTRKPVMEGQIHVKRK